MIIPNNMKKAILTFAIVSLLIVSCKKDSTPSGGSWTFSGNTYQALNCIGDSAMATLTAVNTVSGNTYSNISVSFYNKLPDSSATYTVAKEGNLSPDHVGISVAYQTSSTTTYYGSTGGNWTNQKVNVTVANGRISVAGTNIEIINLGGNTDSTKLSFSISQTQ